MANGFAKRGSALTSSFKRAAGTYIFVTNLNLAGCAMIGTRGSSNTSVPFTPAAVEIGPGPAPDTDIIQIRQLLFFGGGLINQDFQAAGIC